MNSRLILHGIFIVLLWNTQNVSSIFLTSTLMTGLVGGFLLGRMSLGTFLSVLSNNGTRLPSLPSVNLSSILPSFQQLITQQLEADLEDDKPARDILSAAVTFPTTTSAPGIPAIHYIPYMPPPPPNIPQVYTYNFPVYPSYAYQTTTTEAPFKLSAYPIRPIDVPISLDNKIRDRFIRQLAIMDPLNCLPKIFCEVSADPLRATYITNHGTITNVGSMDQSEITQDEMVAYEYHLQRRRTTTTTTTPKPTSSSTTTTTTESPENEDEHNDSDSASEEEAEEADDISGQSGSSESVESVEEDDVDDSFEQYRKEHEHKIEMQALDEMIDDIEDPETYMYILRDKQRRKAARKKYKENQRNKLLGAGASIGEGPSSFRQDDLMVPQYNTEHVESSPMHGNSDFNEEPYTQYLNRRMSADDGPMPPPPMQPPVFIPPGMAVTSTEPTMHDMFSDDPFFDEFSGSSGRSARHFMGKFEKVKRRVKRQSFEKADLMKRYRVAYMVAEKYRSPDMCNTVFRSCPYRASTFLSVVNRMESGLLPFQLPSEQTNNFGSKNNINQFKHTLQAIERLNKATFLAQARGEPLDIDEVAETASNPSSNIDASTSQSIVNEFQKVVASIKTAKIKKKKKPKRKKTMKNQTKYDAVHYYKKAQMERLQPKDRLKKGVFHVKEPVKQQDDELQMHKHLGNVPTFKDTYKEMFKKVKGAKHRSKSGSTTTLSPNVTRNKAKGPKRNYNSINPRVKTTTMKVTTIEGNDEDDEKDAILSEEVVNKSIVKG